jgi:hypothetical protein
MDLPRAVRMWLTLFLWKCLHFYMHQYLNWLVYATKTFVTGNVGDSVHKSVGTTVSWYKEVVVIVDMQACWRIVVFVTEATFLAVHTSIMWYVQVLFCMGIWLQEMAAMYFSCSPTWIVTAACGIVRVMNFLFLLLLVSNSGHQNWKYLINDTSEQACTNLGWWVLGWLHFVWRCLIFLSCLCETCFQGCGIGTQNLQLQFLKF